MLLTFFSQTNLTDYNANSRKNSKSFFESFKRYFKILSRNSIIPQKTIYDDSIVIGRVKKSPSSKKTKSYSEDDTKSLRFFSVGTFTKNIYKKMLNFQNSLLYR